MSKFQKMIDALKHQAEAAGGKVKAAGEKVKPFHALEKEAKLAPVLHAEVLAALKELKKKHPEIEKVLKESAGYAVVPQIGRAALVLGGAYGIGEVFVKDRVIGYAAIIEMTIGVQVGGTTFHEMVVFNDEGALKRFKAGKFAFAADAAVEIVKAGAQASHGFGGSSQIYLFAEGGMLLDLAIGGQKFVFKPAALGRLNTAKGLEEGEKEASDGGGEEVAASDAEDKDEDEVAASGSEDEDEEEVAASGSEDEDEDEVAASGSEDEDEEADQKRAPTQKEKRAPAQKERHGHGHGHHHPR
jgi:lipid-binding SYLF domain-containing protein